MDIDGMLRVLTDDFTVFWAERRVRLDEEIAQTQNTFELSGHGRSKSLMQQLQQVCGIALEDAFGSSLRALARLLEAQPGKLESHLVTGVQEHIHHLLQGVGPDLNQQLERAARNMGFQPEWSVDEKLALLKEKARTEVTILAAQHDSAVERSRLPWYQRPIGLVVLLVIAAVAAALITKLFWH